ncbi:MAG: substrate-binding domain-containing protein [Gammaproteobacteria bacterium]
MGKNTIARYTLIAGLFLAIPLAGHTQEKRDYLMIVGSTTVAPFSELVVKRFVSSTGFEQPMVQPSGSGGGMMLFCSGTDLLDPDIAYASRPIRGSEIDRCIENGVKEFVEIKIGYDGILLAQATDGPRMALTRRDIFLALAKSVPDPGDSETFMDNPYKTWKEVRAELPDMPIKVWGPAPGSGTRYVFARLAMEQGCRTFERAKALEEEDLWLYKTTCRSVRDDGAYTAIGENDDLTAENLDEDPSAIAILSYGTVDEHEVEIRGVTIDGVKPSYNNIANGSYLISRPLFLYVKKASVGVYPGIAEFLAEFTSDSAWAPAGYLRQRGLVAMSEEDRRTYREMAEKLTPMTIY